MEQLSRALANGQAADGVLGQANLSASGSGCTAARMNFPNGVAVDGAGNVWVADQNNNRILRFSVPLSNGKAASLVLGQPDFISRTDQSSNFTETTLANPGALAFDGDGNLWVADYFHCRAVRFDAPFSDNQPASIVLGKPDFTSYTTELTQTGMFNPTQLCVDGQGNLWVTDGAFPTNRVLKYSVPISSGMAATLVLGQEDFVTDAEAVSATGMCSPTALFPAASGNLWVSDADSNRILCFRGKAGRPQTPSGRVDLSTGTVLSIRPASGEIRVVFPAGAFAQAVNVSVTTAAVPSSNTAAVRVGRICLEITNDLGLQPDKDITITVAYRDSDIDGLEDSQLALCRYDGATGTWVRLPTTVDTVNRTITATVRHLSTFVVTQVLAAGNLAQVRAYPVPYTPAQGLMTFDRLTAGATLKFFNVAGEAVRSLTASDTGMAVWDGKNDNGSTVASGVYIVYISGAQGTKKMKIAVEK